MPRADADFDLSGGRPSRLCRDCVGTAMITVATSRPTGTPLDKPFSITFTLLLPNRTPDRTS